MFHDSTFRGWVKQEYIDQFDLPKSQQELDETANSSNRSRVSQGWSDAKARSVIQLSSYPLHLSDSPLFRSFASFQKNPNTYFYRHKAPGEEQTQGEWSEEETKAFMETAKKYGLGDKWGLFSSHVPGRVGYQCANFYRKLLSDGDFYDFNYKIDAETGLAVHDPHNSHPSGQFSFAAFLSENPEVLFFSIYFFFGFFLVVCCACSCSPHRSNHGRAPRLSF